ncbi:GntR family transcriptional regulator [Planctomycetota bacterium]|nr:GntR family transcriptional regulator [Planctomycetota bacterium]
MSKGPDQQPTALPGKDLPRYAAVRQMLQDKILSGEFPLGHQIPTELSLCAQYNLSRKTVHRAINQLVKEGYLIRKRGSGTFVKFKRSQQQKNLIGVLVSLNILGIGAYDQILQSIKATAEEQGFQLLIADTHHDTRIACEKAVELNKRKTVGTIFFPLQNLACEDTNLQIISTLRNAGQHVVVADALISECNDPEVSYVTSQNRQGVYELTQYLIKKGYKRIAFLSSDPSYTVSDREAGFRAAMEEADLEIPPEYFLKLASFHAKEQGIQEIRVLLAMRKPPEVVICLHDLIALNIIRYCKENKIKIPGDIAVAGFDDLDHSSSIKPSLTTVKQPLSTIGEQTVELLIEKIKGKKAHASHIEMPCELIVRKST